MALDLGIFLEGSQSTFKVKVSENDAQAQFLLDKLTSSDGSVTITETNDGGIETIDLVAGGGSPLTTKGDLFTYSTTDARLPIGTDGQALLADSAEATGLKWGTLSVDNMATADLTLTAARTHDLSGFGLKFDNGQTTFEGAGSTSATTTIQFQNSSGEVILRAIDNNSIYSRGNGDLSTNTAFGEESGLALTGLNNTFYGYQAGKANNSGTGNSVFGTSAYRLGTAGINNTALGYQAMQNSSTVNENTAIGRRALIQLGTGDDNTAVGSKAGDVLSGGGGNAIATQGTYLGSNTKPSASGNTNEIIVGYNTSGNGSNTATWGNTSITENWFHGSMIIEDGITAPSSTSGYAKLYVDTADGDLKIIFGDGTVKTITTDS